MRLWTGVERLVPLLVVEALHASPGVAGVALTVCAAGTTALGIAPNVPWLLGLSFAAGIGSGMFTPAQQAVLADVIGPDARGGPVLAGFQMAADLGTVLGPVLVGAIAQRVSFGFALGVTGALLVLAAGAWTVAPETLRRRAAFA
jgi:MFS family permease